MNYCLFVFFLAFFRRLEPFENFCAEAVKKGSAGAARNFTILWKNQLRVINGVSDEVCMLLIHEFVCGVCASVCFVCAFS